MGRIAPDAWPFCGEPHSDAADWSDSLRYTREVAAGVEKPKPPKRAKRGEEFFGGPDWWAALNA